MYIDFSILPVDSGFRSAFLVKMMLLFDIYKNPNFSCLSLSDTEPMINHNSLACTRGLWLVSIGTTSCSPDSTYAFLAKVVSHSKSSVILKVNLYDLHVIAYCVAQVQDDEDTQRDSDIQAIIKSDNEKRKNVQVTFQLSLSCPYLESLIFRRYKSLEGSSIRSADFHRNSVGCVRASIGFLQSSILDWSRNIIRDLRLFNRSLNEYFVVSDDELKFLVSQQGVLYSAVTRDAMIRIIEESTQLKVRVSSCMS